MPNINLSKVITVLLFTFCLFSCSKDKNPFTGNWKGIYTGTGDHGSWDVSIDKNGKISGDVSSVTFSQNFKVTGTVSLNGQISMIVNSVTSGATFSGTLTGNSGSGNWINNSAAPPYTGTWSGNKQ